MKRILTSKILFSALLLGAFSSTSYAQINDADPALTSVSFSHTPVKTSAFDTLTVSFINNGTLSVTNNGTILPNTFTIQISLPTSVPMPEYIASPENTAAIFGVFSTKFTWTYLPATRTFKGKNNVPILPGEGGQVYVNVTGVVSTIPQILSTVNIVRNIPGNIPFDDVSNNLLTAGLAVVPGTVVSVGLLNFTAAPVNKTVRLDWQTTAELNSNYFEVQTSIDGIKWNKIGTVSAAGTSTSERDYSLIHTNPINGLNYYRLKQVDLDGSFKYSVIRTVKFGNKTDIYIMPNPTTDNVYIISGTVGTAKSVGIYSLDGRKLQQLDNYSYGKAIDLSRYAPSTYLIRVTDSDGKIETFQAVKK